MNQDLENVMEFLKTRKDPMDIFKVFDGVLDKEYQQWLEQQEPAR